MKYLTTLFLITCLHVTAMAKEINTEITINANPEKVWSILTRFNDYPNWNPFIISLTGDVQVGNKINVKIQPPDSKPMTFTPKVLVYTINKELRWLGRLGFTGIFDGEHRFELIDNGNGTTTFKQSEKFTGILVWILNMEKTKKGFEAMNAKLKELSER